MEHTDSGKDVKPFFKRLTIKEMSLVLVAVIVVSGLGIALRSYSEKKIAEFSGKLDKAQTVEDYQAILDAGCPSVIQPRAEYLLGAALYEKGDFKESFSSFEKFINKYKKHYLYGRAINSFLHAGIHVDEGTEILDKALALIHSQDMPWKNETLFDIAGYYVERGQKDKAARIYQDIIVSDDPIWKNHAEFKLEAIGK